MSLYVGDVRDGLRKFAADGVRAQTCITSPPYWGLRDYGTALWDGEDAACDHKAPPMGGTGRETIVGTTAAANDTRVQQYRDACGKCGARRIDRQIGLEPTPAEYVATLVDVFRLVRDVLADDGTLWLNLGDSYAGSWGAQSREHAGKHAPNISALSANQLKAAAIRESGTGSLERTPGLKAKDLCGIPWRVAFALQADGWYLRSDIIWHKPNPMPESVTDRPTKAHEYLFLLTKSPTYYYDAASIAEPASGRSCGNRTYKYDGLPGHETKQGVLAVADVEWQERNRRTVWTIATEPYADAHFATFPTALVEPCVLAGSRVGDVVLDPFMGSGTVAKVAQSLGRRWIGCELNPAYAAMVKGRAAQMGMEFA